MKKSLVFAIMLMLIGGIALAEPPSATFEWDPPTHRASGTSENPDCATQGAALTPDELATIEYTFSYRAKGTTTWVNVESAVPTITVPDMESIL